MSCAQCSLCNTCGKYTEVLEGMGKRPCPVCGALAYEAAQVCPSCGAALEISDEARAILLKYEDPSVARWNHLNFRVPTSQ